MTNERGFGIAGTLDHAVVQDVARAAEAAGFQTLWVNDTPDGDALAALAAAASVTERIRLATGVIPVDRQPADRIAARVQELGLPVARLVIGIGGGRAKPALGLVRESVRALHERTGATVVVGALGPKMCALAGEAADGVLLNWLTPEFAATSAAWTREAAERAGRPLPRIDGYVRVALGSAALPELQVQADRYAGIPSYAAHFERMGVRAIETTVAGEHADALQAQLAAYDAVLDETVARAITAEESAEAYLALVEATAPSRPS